MNTDLKIEGGKKVIWDYYTSSNPEEGGTNVSTISQVGINLGPYSSSEIDSFWGSSMVLNRNSLVFDNIWSQNKAIGKITSGHVKKSNFDVISPSILMESAGDMPGTIHLVADSSPSITLKNDKTWSTEIKTSEIRLESQASGNKSYIGNDYLEYKINGNKKSRLNANGLYFDDKLVINKYFFQAPMYTIGNVDDVWQLQSVADKLDCSNNEGRLFMVGDNDSALKKKLLVCIWRPDISTHSYLIVTAGGPWTYT